MAGKQSKLSIWALDPAINLGDLPELFNLDYSKPIDYLIDNNNPQLSIVDKNLLNRWVPYRSENGFDIINFEVLGEMIPCIPVNAHLEFAAPESKVVFGDIVLPRNQRVDPTDLPVFFFEYAGRVYGIINGPEYKTRYIRSYLMGSGRAPADLHTRWGTTQFKNIAPFNFSSDFFYWLITKENSVIKKENYDIEISDIRFLAQSAERKDISHESEGINLLDEAMSKTGLGVNSRLGSVGTTISTDEGTHNFVLFENGDCFVNNYESALNSATGEIMPFDLHLDTGSLMLFAVILPALKSSFNSDSDGDKWTTQHQADARKSWALGAINELCAENEIAASEINDLEWFK